MAFGDRAGGGYPSPLTPPTGLPKVDSGPAPGSSAKNHDESRIDLAKHLLMDAGYLIVVPGYRVLTNDDAGMYLERIDGGQDKPETTEEREERHARERDFTQDSASPTDGAIRARFRQAQETGTTSITASGGWCAPSETLFDFYKPPTPEEQQLTAIRAHTRALVDSARALRENTKALKKQMRKKGRR